MTDLALDRAPILDDLPFERTGPVEATPDGSRFAPDPSKWYYIHASYERNGRMTAGNLYPIGANAAEAFWDYIAIGRGDTGGCQIQFTQIDGGPWYTAKVKADGYDLCMKATGWMYRASAYTAGFMIVDGKLYVDSWSGALGCANSYGLMADTYFVGAKLGNVLTDCKIVEASQS